MILKIKNREGQNLGVIEFKDGELFLVGGGHDMPFIEFVRANLAKGLELVRDIYDPETRTFTMITGLTTGQEKISSWDLKQWLERQGFVVIEKHPEVEEEIRALLVNFPDEIPDKKEILAKLPEMSYLEQTLYLKGLKQIEEVGKERSGL